MAPLSLELRGFARVPSGQSLGNVIGVCEGCWLAAGRLGCSMVERCVLGDVVSTSLFLRPRRWLFCSDVGMPLMIGAMSEAWC